MWELTLVTECNNKRIMDVVLPRSEGVALWTIVDLILAQGNLLQTGSQSFRLALPNYYYSNVYLLYLLGYRMNACMLQLY